MQNPAQSKEPIVLRQSAICLCVRLVVLHILFTSVYIFLLVPILIFDISPQLRIPIYSILGIAFIITILVQLYLTLSIVLHWYSESYVVKQGEIIFKKGIIDHKEKMYTLTHIESITYAQNFWERLFNYGTIRLYNPILNQHIHLDSIRNPEKYVRILENTVRELINKSTGVLFTQKSI